MRYTFFALLFILSGIAQAEAQSVFDNLPPVVIEGTPPAADEEPAQPGQVEDVSPQPAPEPYTVSNVKADVTADTAAHARDKAIVQAQRSAYLQLCERMGVTDSPDNLSDDDLAALVQSFEVQSEHLSAVRYVGVLTIRFNPAALRRRQLALDAAAAPVPGGESAPSIPYAVPVAAAQHLTVAVRANTLAAWTQTKKRLAAIPLVAKLDTLDVARGIIHVDLTYRGTVEELRQAALTQGLMLRQDMSGAMEIYDGASVLR